MSTQSRGLHQASDPASSIAALKLSRQVRSSRNGGIKSFWASWARKVLYIPALTAGNTLEAFALVERADLESRSRRASDGSFHGRQRVGS
jgi:hypothetical protein